MKKRASVLAGVCASMALILVPLAGASAEDEIAPTSPTETSLELGIDTAGGEVAVPGEETAVPEDLQVGEVFTIQTAEGVTSVTVLSATCTETITITNPTQSGARVQATATFKRTSGCVEASKQTTAILWKKGAFGMWDEQSFLTSSMSGAGTKSAFPNRSCTNTKNTTWRAGAFFGPAGTPTNSADITLPCGT